MTKKESQTYIIKYFSLPINLQNGRQQILYLLEIADFSHGIEFIFKAFIGHYNLRTYSSTLIGENNVLISKEREKEWIKN